MTPSASPPEVVALHSSLSSLHALLLHFQSTLQSPIAPNPPISRSLESPFSVFLDAAKLLKAQTTRLSLLILNKPLSPKEITYILDALAKSVVPVLMSGLQLCQPELYTRVLYEHARTLLRILWKELLSLISCIPENEKDMTEQNGKATLTSTGLVWENCDALIELATKGLMGFIDKKVHGYGELFEDAITELEDWDPDEDTDDDEDDNDDEGCGLRKNVINTPTTSDEERLGEGVARMSISPQADMKIGALKHLRLIKLLYPALRKRRIATFPDPKGAVDKNDRIEQIQRLNTLVEHTQRFTEHADDLAASLYSADHAEMQMSLEKIFEEALHCVDLVNVDWTGNEDLFSTWATRWKSRFEELKVPPETT